MLLFTTSLIILDAPVGAFGGVARLSWYKAQAVLIILAQLQALRIHGSWAPFHPFDDFAEHPLSLHKKLTNPHIYMKYICMYMCVRDI